MRHLNFGIVNFLRRDVSDISTLANMEIKKLQIPQIIPKVGENSLKI